MGCFSCRQGSHFSSKSNRAVSFGRHLCIHASTCRLVFFFFFSVRQSATNACWAFAAAAVSTPPPPPPPPHMRFRIHSHKHKRARARARAHGAQIRSALEYVIGEHVGGARSSERETRLINTVAHALVGEEELANPTKVCLVQDVRCETRQPERGREIWGGGVLRGVPLRTVLKPSREASRRTETLDGNIPLVRHLQTCMLLHTTLEAVAVAPSGRESDNPTRSLCFKPPCVSSEQTTSRSVGWHCKIPYVCVPSLNLPTRGW